MPPKPDNTGGKPTDPTINWVEFRDALLESQTNFQTMMQGAMAELTQTLIRNLHPVAATEENRPPNPQEQILPAAGYQQQDLALFRQQEQRQFDTRWENGFRVDISEFHGGIRGDALLDWLIVV